MSTAQHSTAQHSTAQHSTAQHSTAQHSTAQHSTARSNPTEYISECCFTALLSLLTTQSNHTVYSDDHDCFYDQFILLTRPYFAKQGKLTDFANPFFYFFIAYAWRSREVFKRFNHPIIIRFIDLFNSFILLIQSYFFKARKLNLFHSNNTTKNTNIIIKGEK